MLFVPVRYIVAFNEFAQIQLPLSCCFRFEAEAVVTCTCTLHVVSIVNGRACARICVSVFLCARVGALMKRL